MRVDLYKYKLERKPPKCTNQELKMDIFVKAPLKMSVKETVRTIELGIGTTSNV